MEEKELTKSLKDKNQSSQQIFGVKAGPLARPDAPVKKIVYSLQSTSNLQSIIAEFEKAIKQPILLFTKDSVKNKYRQIVTQQQIAQLVRSKTKLFYHIVSETPKRAIKKNMNSIKKEEANNLEDKISAKNWTTSFSLEESTKKDEPYINQTVKIKLEEKSSAKTQVFKLEEEKSEICSDTPTEPTQSKQTKANIDKSVKNLQIVFKNILKQHHQQIKNSLFPKKQEQQSHIFHLTCCLCGNKGLKDFILACEMDLNVVGCQNCSQYLKYQLPFNFKRYESPQEYKAAKESQQKPSQTFITQFQKQKTQRNHRILQSLSNLSQQHSWK